MLRKNNQTFMKSLDGQLSFKSLWQQWKLNGKNKLLKNYKKNYFNIENWIIIRETQLRNIHNDTES